MKHLMDVIVRKRPLPEGEAATAAAAGADARFDVLGEGIEPVEPAAPSAAPQIWDIEAAPVEARPAPAPGESLADQVRRRRGLAASQVAAPSPVAPQAAAGGGRARTRILGFHGAELADDIFAAGRAAPAALARFPAGWLVVTEGPGRGASFTLGAGVSTLGRGADQTVSLDFGDMAISREMHASIAYDEEQNRFFLGHGGKSNIVRRNGNPVLSTEELADRDTIRIGRTVLLFVALCGPAFAWDDKDAETAE